MMAQGLSATVDTRVTMFNTLALQTQDEAYTLAYYLLGDDRHAERATQAAFDQLFRQARLQAGRFRFEVLRRVLEASQTMMRIMPRRSFARAPLPVTGGRDTTLECLMGLKEEERFVVVLVDVLGLNYDETAQVLGVSKKQVGSTLAQARLNMSQADHHRDTASLPLG